MEKLNFEQIIEIASEPEYHKVGDIDNHMRVAEKILSASKRMSEQQSKLLLYGMDISKEIDAECSKAGGLTSMYHACVINYALNYAVNGCYGFEAGFKYLHLVSGMEFQEKMEFRKLITTEQGTILFSKKYEMFFCHENEAYNLTSTGSIGGGYSSFIFKNYETGLNFITDILSNGKTISYVKDVDLIHQGLSSWNYEKLYHFLGHKLWNSI